MNRMTRLHHQDAAKKTQNSEIFLKTDLTPIKSSPSYLQTFNQLGIITFMSDSKLEPIQEAEIINDPSQSSANTQSAQAFDIHAYNATLEIVRRRISILDKAKVELKKLNEMLDDIFVNDADYNKADEAVKEVAKKKKDIQAQLSKQPAAVQANGKIKDLKAQIKENTESLSLELMEYYRTSGVTEIEDADGNVQEFKIVVKLKPKKKSDF